MIFVKTNVLFLYACKHKVNSNKSLQVVSVPGRSLVLLPSPPWRSVCCRRLGMDEKKGEAIWDHICVHTVLPGDSHIVPTDTTFPGSLQSSSPPEMWIIPQYPQKRICRGMMFMGR